MIFRKAAEKNKAGIALISDRGNVYGLGIALEENDIYYIPAGGSVSRAYLCGKIEELAEDTVIASMDIKSMLKHVNIPGHSRAFDLGVAAYLLNPLKSSYTYDDIAKEYLNGRLLPSRGRAHRKSRFQPGGGGVSRKDRGTCLLYGLCVPSWPWNL